jgi:hypothetical protein
MEAGRFTKPSSASFGSLEPKADSAVDLDLPIDPNFHSIPPLIPLADYCRRNRELRQWFPKGIPTDDERWKLKTATPFEL